MLTRGAYASHSQKAMPRNEQSLAKQQEQQLEESQWQGPVLPGPLSEFFRFLCCQLRMEVRERLDPHKELRLDEPEAQAMWPHYEAWVTPNLGKREKWMPFHTVLGAHELFVVQEIHHSKVVSWDARRKFLAMFIFRSHCKADLFLKAQFPLMQEEAFWKDPLSQFAPEGPVYNAMLKYRITTRAPMQTSAFRAIPRRLCADDDENLVLNITERTQALLVVAEKVWPVVCDDTKPVLTRFDEISREILGAKGLGDTWSKMLMVTIDIAYPHIGLLAEKCDVGVGAEGGLRRLLNEMRLVDKKASLEVVTQAGNRDKLRSLRSFWTLLPQVETMARDTYKECPLVLKQMSTPRLGLSAVTVQVQLCEWRQFNEYLEKEGVSLPSSSAALPKVPQNLSGTMADTPRVKDEPKVEPRTEDEDEKVEVKVEPSEQAGGVKREVEELADAEEEHAQKRYKSTLEEVRLALDAVGGGMVASVVPESCGDSSSSASEAARGKLEKLRQATANARAALQAAEAAEREQEAIVAQCCEGADSMKKWLACEACRERVDVAEWAWSRAERFILKARCERSIAEQRLKLCELERSALDEACQRLDSGGIAETDLHKALLHEALAVGAQRQQKTERGSIEAAGCGLRGRIEALQDAFEALNGEALLEDEDRKALDFSQAIREYLGGALQTKKSTLSAQLKAAKAAEKVAAEAMAAVVEEGRKAEECARAAARNAQAERSAWRACHIAWVAARSKEKEDKARSRQQRFTQTLLDVEKAGLQALIAQLAN